jgi:hypothetical protein
VRHRLNALNLVSIVVFDGVSRKASVTVGALEGGVLTIGVNN